MIIAMGLVGPHAGPSITPPVATIMGGSSTEDSSI